MLELFNLPFFQRAVIGTIIVTILCSVLGVFVILRKEAFITDAIAHSSLTGVGIALLLGIQPMFIALIVAIITSILISYFQKKSKVASDSIIGIFFSLIFAIGIILINLDKGYKPDLTTFLFGSILSIDNVSLHFVVFTTIISLLIILIFYRELLFSSFYKTGAILNGIKVDFFDLLIRILFSLAIVMSVKVAGVILVTSLFIVPSSIAKLTAKSFSGMFFISTIIGVITSLIGLFISYLLNFPSGATIVVVESIFFIFFALFYKK